MAGAPECPHSPHAPKLYRADCHGKTIDIALLKAPSSRAEPYDESIVAYDPDVSKHACSTAGAPCNLRRAVRPAIAALLPRGEAV